MIVIAMSDRENVDVFSLRPANVVLEVVLERHPLVLDILRVINIGVVKDKYCFVLEFDHAAVRVAKRVQRDRIGLRLHRFTWLKFH